MQLATSISEDIKNTLNRFSEFIDQCTGFVSKFHEVSRFKRLYAHRDHNTEFGRDDKELSSYATDLQLGLNIAQISDRE